VSQQLSAVDRPKICNSCYRVLFFILRISQYYCKYCRYYLISQDNDGHAVRNLRNPLITMEEIERLKKSDGPKVVHLRTRVIYKLSRRPQTKG
jgi:hypothetical protein